jgi:hypothetical protein
MRGNWISVEKKLPEFGVFVLCRMNFILDGRKYRIMKRNETKHYKLFPYQWDDDNDNLFDPNDVSHFHVIEDPLGVNPVDHESFFYAHHR